MPKSIQNKNKSYVHFGIYALKKRGKRLFN